MDSLQSDTNIYEEINEFDDEHEDEMDCDDKNSKNFSKNLFVEIN